MKTADDIAAWMRGILRSRDWSAREWAIKSGISPTTITRFLNGDVHHVPSARTLAKLAATAGSNPFEQVQGISAIPLYMTPDQYGVSRKRIPTPSDTPEDAYAVVTNSNSMNASGIMAGDTIICLPAHPARLINGAMVVIATNSAFKVMKYHPPYFVPNSTDSNELPVNQGNAKLIGVAYAVYRRL